MIVVAEASEPDTVATVVPTDASSAIDMLVVTFASVSATEIVGAVESIVKSSRVRVLLSDVPLLIVRVQL